MIFMLLVVVIGIDILNDNDDGNDDGLVFIFF